jgi:membrane associated rhomboid family serine protease
LIPYRDENQTLRTPVVTIALIAANVIVWLLVQGAGMELPLARSVCNLGLIAGELTGLAPPGTTFPLGRDLACVVEEGRGVHHLFTSMFLHGSWMHLIGNMWFLWIFGNNIEDSMGRVRFVAFYLICGLAAAAAQIATDPGSVVPMIGASGAISGVMGAYLILYPRVRVFTLVPIGFFLTSIALPAWTMLLYWMLLQLISGLGALAGASMGGVAFFAHIGGFAAGALLIKLFTIDAYVRAHLAQKWNPRRVGWRQN